ncbi:MAG: hypothetical protein E2O50_01495 [Gammaproteobacteria bacterium]|nr:MAG: hypothetical protein E2O50_01495 [Gammaproteobacteria bacterium]
MRGIFWSLSLAVLLAGCGDAGTTTSADSQDTQVDEERAPTVFDPMIGTMDRARGVQDLSNNRMDELNRQLEESE